MPSAVTLPKISPLDLFASPSVRKLEKKENILQEQSTSKDQFNRALTTGAKGIAAGAIGLGVGSTPLAAAAVAQKMGSQYGPAVFAMLSGVTIPAGLVGGVASRASDSLGGSILAGAAGGAGVMFAIGLKAQGANGLSGAATLAVPGAVVGGIAGAVEHFLLDPKKK